MSESHSTTLSLTITEPAHARILDLLVAETDGDALAVWLEVSGSGSGGSNSYEMYFEELGAAAPEDAVEDYADFAVVIPQASVEKVRGAIIAVSGERLVVRNPNGASQPATGDLAHRVMRVLEEQINPAIAAHGGRADLVAVEERVAYLRLSGGCQGCGIAGITIKQGIEVAILDAVPEIAEVVDVTDHAGGADPFYESPER